MVLELALICSDGVKRANSWAAKRVKWGKSEGKLSCLGGSKILIVRG